MTDKDIQILVSGLVPELKALFELRDTRISELGARLAALEAAPLLKDAGIWKHGASYTVGDVAQFSGSPWVCTRTHTAHGPTADHTCWRLWVKSGKDGKDLR